MKKDAAIAMTTTNSEREAKELASLLVEGKLAACVQIIPKILSIYRWEGKVHEDQEYLLLIKGLEDRMGEVKAAIEKHHSYEVPEFLVVPVVDGLKNYLEWIAANCKA